MPPTVFLGDRTEHAGEWTLADSQYAMALEDYERECDDRGHYLPETTKPEHDDAYRPDPATRTRCYKCRAQDLLAEVLEKFGGAHVGAPWGSQAWRGTCCRCRRSGPFTGYLSPFTPNKAGGSVQLGPLTITGTGRYESLAERPPVSPHRLITSTDVRRRPRATGP